MNHTKKQEALNAMAMAFFIMSEAFTMDEFDQLLTDTGKNCDGDDFKRVSEQFYDLAATYLVETTPPLVSCTVCDGTGKTDGEQCEVCWGSGLVSEGEPGSCSICDTDGNIDLDTSFICSGCAAKYAGVVVEEPGVVIDREDRQ